MEGGGERRNEWRRGGGGEEEILTILQSEANQLFSCINWRERWQLVVKTQRKVILFILLPNIKLNHET